MDKLILGYMVVISLIAFFMTYYDKRAARKRKRRISEKNLLTVAFVGGALSMYVTMLSIRHKTKHIKFMFFLPFFAVMHIILLYILFK